MYKFECAHADTCLPDYWSGHHLPHISIPVYPMTLEKLKDNLHDELVYEAISGAAIPYDMPDDWFVALHDAIDAIESNTDILFADIESGEDFESVYAYFVFVEKE